MINDNEDIASGRGNDTLCRIIYVKFHRTVTPKIRNFDNKKVYAVNARDVDYIECEHFPKEVELMKMEKKLGSIDQMSSLDSYNQVLSKEMAKMIDLSKEIARMVTIIYCKAGESSMQSYGIFLDHCWSSLVGRFLISEFIGNFMFVVCILEANPRPGFDF